MATWQPLIRLVTLLPQALDRQLRENAGVNHAHYTTLVILAQAPDRRLTMGELAPAPRARAPRDSLTQSPGWSSGDGAAAKHASAIGACSRLCSPSKGSTYSAPRLRPTSRRSAISSSAFLTTRKRPSSLTSLRSSSALSTKPSFRQRHKGSKNDRRLNLWQRQHGEGAYCLPLARRRHGPCDRERR